jgi:hypothetical protein
MGKDEYTVLYGSDHAAVGIRPVPVLKAHPPCRCAIDGTRMILGIKNLLDRCLEIQNGLT